MHFLQAQAVELLLDAVSKGLNGRRNLRIQWRPTGMPVQRRHYHFVVWFQIGQHRGPRPPDSPDPVQQQQGRSCPPAVARGQLQRGDCGARLVQVAPSPLSRRGCAASGQ